MKNLLQFASILVCLFLLSCNGDSNQNQQIEYTLDLNFERVDVQRAYELKSNFQVDSLRILLESPDPTMRLIAVRAFSDWESDAALDKMEELLYDPNREVRLETAYALGQIMNPQSIPALLELFQVENDDSIDQELLANALEAVGKMGEEDYLDALATISTYSKDDGILLKGQAYSIYRYLLRGMESEMAYQKMLEFLTADYSSEDLRTIAAQYFLRSSREPSEEQLNQLLSYVEITTNRSIKKNLWLALAKTKNTEVLTKLKESYRSSSDRMEKLTLLEAFEQYRFGQISDIARSEISNTDQRIATEAADLFVKTGSNNYGKTFLQDSFKAWPWYVKSKIQAAVNKYMYSPEAFRKMNIDLVYKEINSAKTVEEKVAYLQALSTYPVGINRIIGFYRNDENPRVRSACASMVKTFVLNRQVRIGNNVKSFVNELLTSDDVASISQACEMISGNDELFQSTQIELVQAKMQELELPLQLEAYMSLSGLSQKLAGVETKQQPIYDDVNVPKYDWNELAQLGEQPKAVITTSKGKIEIELDVKSAPISVMNFIDLSKDGFYNQKDFHRVVTNFVVQAGCERGDGYGSVNYNIPTETPNLHFDEPGYIGMASAGRNTESSQWFISLAPTMHLDGRYTIFGKITQGLDVLDELDPFDVIQQINIFPTTSDQTLNDDENNRTYGVS